MNKIPVAILGATGIVGQRFIELLANHPWFEISALVGSSRSAGKRFGDACNWGIAGDPPKAILDKIVLSIEDDIPCIIAFSALPTSIAKDAEARLAKEGKAICSNASAFRQHPHIPVIIPEVNGDHIKLVEKQKDSCDWDGLILTSPNCTTTGVVMPLAPLNNQFQINKLSVVSLQAVSGAGYPGIPFLDINDNVIPYIGGEEEKVEIETKLLLGHLVGSEQKPSAILVSAQTNRVNVSHGHTICLSVGFDQKPSIQEAIEVMSNYKGHEISQNLPSSPKGNVIQIRNEENRPQPRRDRDTDGGMICSVGRVRECSIFDLKMVSVTHNAIRGAAGGSVLNAEMLVKAGYVK